MIDNDWLLSCVCVCVCVYTSEPSTCDTDIIQDMANKHKP